MASSLNVLLTINIAGAPLPFAQPFTVPIVDLEQEPAVYQVTIGAASVGTVWDGAPLADTFNFVAIVGDRACDIEFTVNGGEADESHFTVALETPGVPFLMSGGSSYTGQTGSEDAFTDGTLQPITQIRASNRDEDNSLVLSVVIGQAAS